MTLASGSLIAGVGTVLTCPGCRAIIGTLRKPLYQGWTFGLDCIEFREGQYPIAGQARCRNCGADYSQVSRSLLGGDRLWIHTEHGWLPPDPVSAVAKPGVIGLINLPGSRRD